MTIAVMGVLLFAIAFGVLNCFFGVKFIRAMLFLHGFVLGLVVGFILTATLDDLVSLLITLAIAVVLGLVAYSVYNLGIFLVGGTTAALIVLIILNAFDVDLSKWYSVFSLAGVFIVAGIFSVKFKRMVITVCTALNGGTNLAMFGGALLMYFGEIISPAFEALDFTFFGAVDFVQRSALYYTEANGLLFIISSIVLIGGGIFVQLKYTSKKVKL